MGNISILANILLNTSILAIKKNPTQYIKKSSQKNEKVYLFIKKKYSNTSILSNILPNKKMYKKKNTKGVAWRHAKIQLVDV